MALQPLLAIFSRGHLISPESALDNAKLILECFTLHIDPSKLDEYLGQIFSEENGLKNFLLDKLTVKSFNSSKEQILRLLKFILDNDQKHRGWEGRVFPFIHHFMETTKLYWRNSNEPAKHQQISLECLITIFENYKDAVDLTEIPGLYWELLAASEKSSFQPSVRGKIFHTLGAVAGLTHKGFLNRDDYFNQLYCHIVKTLKGQVESKDAHLEVAILHGCLKAMDKLLQFFSSKMDKNGENWKHFYENLAQVVDPQCSIASPARSGQGQIKRREFQRAGLEVIANNGELFNKELFIHYDQWYKDLILWSKSSNTNDSSVGKRAMFSYLKAIFGYATSITQQVEDEEKLRSGPFDKFVNYFITTFERVLAEESSRRNETIVAITGIGLLSPLCQNASKLAPIAERIFDNVEKIVLELRNPILDKYSSSLSILSTYLEAISNLLFHVIGEDETESNANPKFLSHLNLIEQLVIQFLRLYPQLSAYHQKSAHHCFLKIVFALHSKHSRHCTPFTDRVVTVVLNQAIASPTSAELDILTDAWKANNEKQSEDGSTRTKYPTELRGVLSYMGIWTNAANSKSEPIASKLIFDRIMSWALSTTDKLNLTMRSSLTDEDSQQEQQPSDIYASMIAEKPKDFQLFINLVEFLQKLLNGLSDEDFFSSWVTEFISNIIGHSINHPFVSGFYKILGTALGITSKLNYFDSGSMYGNENNTNLKEKCSIFMNSILVKMDTFRDDLLIAVLELWIAVPDEILILNIDSWCLTLQKIFKMGRMCLPLADKSADALQRWMTVDNIPREAIEDIVIKLFPLWHTYFLAEGTGISQAAGRNRPLPKSKSKKAKQEEIEVIRANVEDEELLLKVQVKILKVIGSFAHVIDLEENYKSVDIGIEQNYNVLKFKIPFGRDGFEIYLDYLCPRAIQLCEDSANRQVRTTACEFLHTAFLYFLGYSVNSNMSGQQPINLFKQLFKTVIKLSGDFDFLIRQLFNPLASQCIHYVTGQSAKPYSEAILQILVDGIVSDDSQLKDFSADCIYEYFKWSLKHGNKSLARDVIGFIVALSSHANTNYRLGACIIFNSIYQEFREEYELVNYYSIVLITGFLTSLSISSEVDDESVIVKSTQASIAHLTRIIVKKKDNFNNNIGKRKKPPGFPSSIVLLRDLTNWLILELGRSERLFREECTRLLLDIAPVVKGAGSVEGFFSTCNHDARKLIEVAEQKRQPAKACAEDLLSFLDAATEFYAFLHQHNSLGLSMLQHPESALISSAEGMFGLPLDPQHLKAMARISVRLSKLQASFSDDAFKKELYKFIINASKKMANQEDMLELIQVLAQSKSAFSPSMITQLEVECSKLEIENILSLPAKSIILSLRWLRLATENQLFEIPIDDAANIGNVILNDLLRRLFGTPGDSCNTNQEVLECPDPDEQELEELFKLCLALGVDNRQLLDIIFDPHLFQAGSKKSPGIPITKGEHFQTHLASSLFHPNLLDFRKLSMSIKIETIGNFIEFLLKTIQRNKPLRSNSGQLLFQNVLKIWTPISVNCDKYTVARILKCLTWLNFEACRDSSQLCLWWCGKDVMGGINSDISELTEFIGFLGLFGLSTDAKIVTDVINATDKVIRNNFPSSAAVPGHQECITGLVTQIMGVFERNPKNVKMLELIPLIVLKLSAFPDDGIQMNFLFKEISRRFLKFSQFGSEQEVLEAGSSLLGKILSGSNDTEMNRNLFLYCLRPIVIGMTRPAFKLFFRRKIKLLMDSLLNSTKSISTPSIPQLNVDRVIYNLITIAVKRLGSKFLEELTAEYKQRQGEEEGVPEPSRMTIVKVVSTAFLQIKRRKISEISAATGITNSLKLHETLLACHSSAYSALASLLISSPSHPQHQRLIEGMLIHEDRSKTFLWENLIDCSDSVQSHFPVLLEPEKSIEPTIDEQEEFGEDTVNIIAKNMTAAKQFVNARANLSQSSLSGDVTGTTFDFTTSIGVTETPFYEGAALSQSRTSTHLDNAQRTLQLDYKCDAFSEESIEGLASTIKKLVTLCNPETLEVQKWMEYLRDVLMGSHHENIKIFILTAMLNCQKELMPYGNMFIGPICKLISDNQTWEHPLNYFVKDVIVMLLDWNEVATPGMIPGTNDARPDMFCYITLNIIAQHTLYSRSDLLETNLSLLDAVVKLWGIQSAHLNILTQTAIFTVIISDTPKVGILICKCLLENNIIPLEDPRELLRQFCKLLKNSSKPIYSDSAECIGLLFKFLKNVNCPTEQATASLVEKLKVEKSRPLPYVLILSQVQKNYPVIISFFNDELMEMLGKTGTGQSFGIVKILFSSLLLRAENSLNAKVEISSFISDLNGRNVFNVPCTSEDAALGISIFEEFAKYPDAYPSELCMKMVSWLNVVQEGVEDSMSLLARYYRCILEIFIHSLSLSGSDRKLIFDIFTNGLKHDQAEVGAVVDEFWRSALQDCENPAELFIKLVQLFGEGSNSLQIILGRCLQRCSLAPEFQKNIFDKPLEDCIFYEYNLDTSWRTKQASFLPLFAESISSQQFSTIPQSIQASVMRQRLSVPQFGVNMLRASLSLRQQQFTPTVQGRGEEYEDTGGFPSFSEFDRMEIDDDSQATQVMDVEPKNKETTNLMHLKKRFYNRSIDNASFFARRQRDRNTNKLSTMKEKLKSKQNMRVTRKYRIGEIPDILIKHADLLTTLVKLGQCDPECGRLLVGQIFSKVLHNNDTTENGIGSALDGILQNPKISKVLAATIIDISIRNNLTISSNSITSIGTTHNLHELCIILLENQIKMEPTLGLVAGEEQAAKRRRIETSATPEKLRESVFLNIIELYSELEEVDVLKNIFVQLSENSASGHLSQALTALNLESLGKFDEAVDQYAELFQDLENQSDDILESYGHFIESSYFECLSKLSEWNQLMDIVGLSNDQSMNDSNWRQSKRLCLSARTGLMMTLEGKKHASLMDLDEFIQRLDNPDCSSQFSLERALMWLTAGLQNANKATVLLEQFWPQGIMDFANFSNLSQPQKNETMLQYQLASMLNDILLWQKNLDLDNVEQKTTQVLAKLGKLIGNEDADLFNSGMLTSARSFFVKTLLHHDLLIEKEEFSKKMSLINFEQHLWILSLGIRDQTMSISNKYLDSSRILGDDISSNDFLSWRKAYISYLACFRTSTPQDDWGKMWGSAWKKVKPGSSTSEENGPQELIQMQSELLRSLAGSLSQGEISHLYLKFVNKALGVNPSFSIIEAVDAGCNQLFDLVNQTTQTESLSPDASMQLYQLMEELLRRFPETYSCNTGSLTLLLESLIRSMSSENDQVLLFPRLLDFAQQHPELHESFLALSPAIPTWKFLPWLDQIIATYESDPVMHQLLTPLLERIIKDYPYAFRLQHDNFLPSTGDHHADYLSSLKALVLPTVLHKRAIDEILTKIRNQNVEALRDAIIRFGQTLQEILDRKEIYGSLHLDFAQEVLGILSPRLNSTDEEFLNQSQDFLIQLKQEIEAIRKAHENRIFSAGRSGVQIKELKEFSPWLANFHHFQSQESIQFPGLFDQLSKPDISTHPVIVSFHSTVQVYHSLTFPIRITILGNDGKKRNFLTKYGDDLRKDRRFQQLFRVANNFFASNSQTRQRKINIVTYSAVPITTSFGIIEWLDKTCSMSSFILNTKQLEVQQNAAVASHREWLEKTSGLKWPSSPYHHYHVYAGAAKKGTRQNAEAHFNVISKTTPTSLLSDHLMECCRSYEQFFKVRQNFVRSYAAMCLVHWLLGIGDRHLQNSLLSLETGKIIGIDFGRVFEVTNNCQNIPEMIPFRLTPNFTNLMMPYGYKGLFRETMCISWRCLLEWSTTILFIINTFVNDRNINWTTARKNNNEPIMGESVDATENGPLEWIPMQIIKRKLLCENPTNILLDTLESNPTKEIVPIYCDIVKNGRQIMDSTPLSQEQVIDCLLDLATDKNILARLYVGLLSWI